MKWFLFVFVSAISLLCQVTPAQTLPQAKLDSITQVLEREVEAKRIPGAVAAISLKGKPVYFEAVGYHDAHAKAPMQKDAIFRIASMTKAVTSVAVMQLVEQGRISLDDPLSKYLPRSPICEC